MSFIGTSALLRKQMIRELNMTYQTHILSVSKQNLAYKVMVDTYPARCLSGYTYEERPKPLRSKRIAVVPVQTDVS